MRKEKKQKQKSVENFEEGKVSLNRIIRNGRLFSYKF